MANVVQIILKGTDLLKAPFTQPLRTMRDLKRAAQGLALAGAAMATAVLGGLIKITAGALRTADEMAKMSQQVGWNVEALSKLAFAAELSAVSVEDLRTGLFQLSRSVTTAASDIESRQARAFAAMGVSLRDANGELRTSQELLLNVADRFRSYADGAEKSALAMEIFGKSGARMIPLLNAGAEGIKTLGDNTVGVSEDTAKLAQNFNDNMTILGRQVKDLGLRLAKDLLPHLVALSQWLVKLQADSQGFGAIAAFLIGAIKTLAIGVFSLVSAFVALGKAMGTSLGVSIEIFARALDYVIESIKSLKGQLGELALFAGRLAVRDFAGIALMIKQGFADRTLSTFETLRDKGLATLEQLSEGARAAWSDTIEDIRSDFLELQQQILNLSEGPGPLPPVTAGALGPGLPSAPMVGKEDPEIKNRIDLLTEEQKLLADLALMRTEEHQAQLGRVAELAEFHRAYSEVIITAHAGWLTFLANTSQTVMTGLGNAVAAIATGAMTAKEAFAALGKQMIAMVVNFMAQRLIAFALEKILAAASRGLQAAAVATSVAAGAATAAAWAPAATAALIATLGAAGASAAALAPLMAANAATAAALSLSGGVLGAAHNGLGFVPEEGTYLLQRGERVIQPAQNEDLTRFLSEMRAGLGRATVVNLAVNVDDRTLLDIVAQASKDGRLTIDGRSIA